MLTALASRMAYADPGPGWWGDGHGPWNGGGPGWWLVIPIVFWVLVLSAAGYLIYRTSPARSARSAGERALAEGFARGEISEDELKQRRAALRGRS